MFEKSLNREVGDLARGLQAGEATINLSFIRVLWFLDIQYIFGKQLFSSVISEKPNLFKSPMFLATTSMVYGYQLWCK